MLIFFSLLILLGSGGQTVPFDTSTGGPGTAVTAAAIVAPSPTAPVDDTSAGGPGP